MTNENNNLPRLIEEQIKQYPQNRRRPVNKVVYANRYFALENNIKENTFSIVANDLVFSAIPYDTARYYIERAARYSMLSPEKTRRYLESHEDNIKTYIGKALMQKAGVMHPYGPDVDAFVAKNEAHITTEYHKIFEHPLFEIQVLGRLMQHDSTGPLSANLAGKFLYDSNRFTGIMGYISEYMKFIAQVTNDLQISTDGSGVMLLSEGRNFEDLYVSADTDLTRASELLPAGTVAGFNSRAVSNITEGQYDDPDTRILLKSVVGAELSKARQNYTAHSVNPKLIDPYYKIVLPTSNNNKINVVSDIHAGLVNKDLTSLPFSNDNFNIIAGDASDGRVSDKNIKGIYVIGNHDMTDVLAGMVVSKDDTLAKYRDYQWFQLLVANLGNDAWPLLPAGDNDIYSYIADDVQSRFPQLKVLNNEGMMYDGVRYAGLTVPIRFANQAAEQQWIADELIRILGDDITTPTVVVSHAPVFNELSMLSKKSKSFSDKYALSNNQLAKIFTQYNIIGAVHGHHHIPAAQAGWHKIVKQFGRPMFVIDSIYANNNTGQELEKEFTRQRRAAESEKQNNPNQLAARKARIESKTRKHSVDDDIKQVVGLTYEKPRNRYTVNKTIDGKHIRKHFLNKAKAIAYLNQLNGH